ncbi:MAG TPA: hypothetical protein VHA74_00205 [Candidatus Dojkabacteria bacterium]|nr:hypothetical protein [Candidatus Dojkabacteria bacterium]
MNPNTEGFNLMDNEPYNPLLVVQSDVKDDQVKRAFEVELVSFKSNLEKEPDIVGSIVADQTVLTYVRPIETHEPVKQLDPLGNEYARKKFDILIKDSKGRAGFIKRLGELSVTDGSYTFPSGKIEYHHDGEDRKIILLDNEGKQIETIAIGS